MLAKSNLKIEVFLRNLMGSPQLSFTTGSNLSFNLNKTSKSKSPDKFKQKLIKTHGHEKLGFGSSSSRNMGFES